MPMYTFHLFTIAGPALVFEAVELPHDGATFAHAGELLDRYLSADHVEVWDGERSVVARYREQPVIRPIEAANAW